MSSNSSSGGTGGGGTPRLVRLDDALSGGPAPERTALEWDESAETVRTRLSSGPRTSASVSDEALLSAPLATTQEEVQSSAALAKDPARGEASMNTTSSRARDRASLKELAKMAETPAPGSTQPAGRSSRPSYPGAVSPASGKFEAKEPTSSPQPTAEREENSGIINLAALTAEDRPAESAPVSGGVTAPASAPVAVAKVAAPRDSKPSRLYMF